MIILLKLLTYLVDIITRKRWRGPGFIEGISQLVKNKEWYGIGYQLPPLYLVDCKNDQPYPEGVRSKLANTTAGKATEDSSRHSSVLSKMLM